MKQFFALSSLFALTCASNRIDQFPFGENFKSHISNVNGSTWSADPANNNFGSCSIMPAATLPVRLTNFQGSLNDKRISLQWNITENQTADQFEIQRSSDGANFNTVALMFTSEKSGVENYTYNESLKGSGAVYYRLKMHDQDQQINYSEILAFETGNESKQLKLLNNPATDRLAFSFVSEANSLYEVHVYDINGKLQLRQTMNASKGINAANISITSLNKTGMYIIELNNGPKRQAARFVKQ